MVLHVQDHGPGTPEPERDKVMQRFQRGRSATGTRGSGLGLALEQQRGDQSIRSEAVG